METDQQPHASTSAQQAAYAPRETVRMEGVVASALPEPAYWVPEEGAMVSSSSTGPQGVIPIYETQPAQHLPLVNDPLQPDELPQLS